MSNTDESSAAQKISKSSLGSFSIYLKTKPVITEAVATVMLDPRNPNVTAVLESYQKFATFHVSTEPGWVLDNFMVQVTELLKKNGVAVDALAMYTLRFKIALQLAIGD